MNIIIGKQYINKTWRFLYPSLRGHGDIFAKKLNQLHKLAIGISDYNIIETEYSKQRTLFVMIDTFFKSEIVKMFMKWIVYQPYYKHHYYIDSHQNEESRKMIIIIEVPEMFNNAYDKFIESKYSEMYNNEEKELLFNTELRKEEYKIVTKQSSLHEEFIKKINSIFGTPYITDFDKPVKEYELPLDLNEEIFNYSTSKKQEKLQII